MNAVKKKIWINVLMAIVLVASVVGFALNWVNTGAYNPKVSVTVNGKAVKFPDAQPYVDQNTGRTMVPIRFISEQLGATVKWDNPKRQVVTTYNGTTIILPIGKKTATVNGKTVTFDAPAILKGDRTFVPLRFISETLKAKVEWVAEKNLVVITTAKKEEPNKEMLGNVGVVPPSQYDKDFVQADPNADSKKTKQYVQDFARTVSFSNGKVTGKGVSIPSGFTQSINFALLTEDGEPDYNSVQYVQLKAGQSVSFNVPNGKKGVLSYGINKGTLVVQGIDISVPDLKASYIVTD